MGVKSEDKVLAGLSHLGIFLNLVGVIGVLIIYLVKKDESHYVGDHAKQALGYQVVIMILSWMVGIVFMGGAIGSVIGGSLLNLPSIIPVGLIGSVIVISVLSTIITLVICGYAIFASIKAFQGDKFKYILIGDFVDKL